MLKLKGFTSKPLPGGDTPQGGRTQPGTGLHALLRGFGASGVKGAPWRRVDGIGVCDAKMGFRQAQPRFRGQYRSEQGMGIGMARIGE